MADLKHAVEPRQDNQGAANGGELQLAPVRNLAAHHNPKQAKFYSEPMFPPVTFGGRDLTQFSWNGYATDGTVIRFANAAGKLSGWNFHYSEHNMCTVRTLATWANRITSNAHQNKAGDWALGALAKWLTLDFAGIPMFGIDRKTGERRFLLGRGTTLPFLGDPYHAPFGWESYTKDSTGYMGGD